MEITLIRKNKNKKLLPSQQRKTTKKSGRVLQKSFRRKKIKKEFMLILQIKIDHVKKLTNVSLSK